MFCSFCCGCLSIQLKNNMQQYCVLFLKTWNNLIWNPIFCFEMTGSNVYCVKLLIYRVTFLPTTFKSHQKSFLVNFLYHILTNNFVWYLFDIPSYFLECWPKCQKLKTCHFCLSIFWQIAASHSESKTASNFVVCRQTFCNFPLTSHVKR